MQTIDWVLVVIPIVGVIAFAIYTQRYVKGVADFVAGGRCAGRYLLANARGTSDSGLANTMAKFEQVLVSGFVLNFWLQISTPVMLLMAIVGFVSYRLRETRALTLAQFLEIRYTRNFRLFMGFLSFLSGILNYGVFPAISARFFIYFMDLPLTVAVGSFHVPMLGIIMAAYLSCTVVMVIVGGQVTAMVVDCAEGIFSHIIYIVIVIVVFMTVSWGQVIESMAMAKPGFSAINPFDADKVQDFNLWFVIMTLAISVYSRNAMQNKQGFMAAARTPHESRMGEVLGTWRAYARGLMLLVLGICAMAFINHPAFAQQAAPVHQAIGAIKSDYIQKQMTVPIALRYLLPVGIKGLFCAIMIMGLLAGDAGHLHSWGSIFVQDVIVPWRKTPMAQRQHMWALRLGVIGVAIFAWLFSTLFTQQQYITLWWAITGSVYTAGAGAAILGGLYWKRGTTQAAWVAAVVGMSLCLAGIACGSYWKEICDLLVKFGVQTPLPAKFWLNFQESAFYASGVAAVLYVTISLATCREFFNLDKMLHRGIYADNKEGAGTQPSALRTRFRLGKLLGFNNDFTRTDKVVSASIFWWSIIMFVLMLVICVWNGFEHWSIQRWATYWWITAIVVPGVIAAVTLVWFSIGGIVDMRDFFRALRTMNRDVSDDGRVPEKQQGHGFEVLKPAAQGTTTVPPPAPAGAAPTAK